MAAIMASPLSSAGTSTQARLSLRRLPACLFMATPYSVRLSVQLWRGPTSGMFAPGGTGGYDLPKITLVGKDALHAGNVGRGPGCRVGAQRAGAVLSATPGHRRGADRRRRR